jgi:High potential iron-sulfur protein
MNTQVKETTMKKTIAHPAEISRRTLISTICVAAPAIVAAAAAAPAYAQAARKMPQRAVAYQPTPRGDQRCDNCTLFEAPNACRTVAGTVAPEGWCRIYVRGRPQPAPAN